MTITMTNNPKINPLYFKKEMHDFLSPHMKNKNIPLWNKLVAILFTANRIPTYIEKECITIQTTPGRTRSVDDLIRILYGLGYKPAIYKIFNTIYKYDSILFGIGYCSTIQRQIIWVRDHSLSVEILDNTKKVDYRNVEKYYPKEDISVSDPDMSDNNYKLIIVKYKLFNNKVSLINRNQTAHSTPNEIQIGYISVIEWNTINKNTKFEFSNIEQYR